MDLLGINPVTIGQAIKATRQLLDEEKISVTPTVVRYFTRADDLRACGHRHQPRRARPAAPDPPCPDRPVSDRNEPRRTGHPA